MNNLLLDAARQAAKMAYCPYSNFPVGAAVLMADGEIFTGCNIENASYGLTICAERVALFKAVSEGKGQIEAIAVSCLKSDPAQPSTLMPCGACRQVMAEFMSPEASVYVDGIKKVYRIAELLPNSFSLFEEATDATKMVH